jgi:hypothetical protein
MDVSYLYLAFITLMLCVFYFILLSLLPIFFGQKVISPRRKPFLSIIVIIGFSVLAYALSYSIQNIDLSDRVLHILGGGFAGFLVCFFAVRDSRISINKFQFFLFSALIVIALGVANELAEFVMQYYNVLISATTVEDTWLDLASNVVGIFIASACLVPFHKQHALDHI